MSKCPTPIAKSNVTAEQQAIMTIDLNGMLILLKPYVKPTEKLSKLTANANKKSDAAATINHAPSEQKLR